MTEPKYIYKLNSVIKQLKDEDLVPALFLMEMDKEFNIFYGFNRELDKILMRNFNQIINSSKELNEIRKTILNYYSTQDQKYIDDFTREVEDLNFQLPNRGKDILKYQSNPRLLAFALNYYNVKFRYEDNIINKINNPFYKFLFIIYCHPIYSQRTTDLNRIEDRFSGIINSHPIHFQKNDTIDFYIWAKNYMDDNDKYDSKVYTPITNEEYRTTVNIIFDKLFDENKDIYAALKEKLSNAWYQKKYRQKNKGKKAHHYVLQKNTLIALESLASKRKLTHEKIIENLINEHYVKECADPNSGDSLY